MTSEIWITGYGFVSPLGNTAAECWESLQSGASTIRRQEPCGYAYHPVLGFDPAKYVQRRQDIRQMGDLMLYATVAAAKALERAGLTSGSDALSRLQICIAADGGERDVEADEGALRAAVVTGELGLNAELMRARPSHFLTQLPNLIPSNICIVNGFAAPSRTLMGTEATSVEALRNAAARIRSGQGEVFLVGSAKNAADALSVISFAADGVISHDPQESVWREDGSGFCVGSVGAFLVVESADHARARGAEPIARLGAIDTSFALRGPSVTCEKRLLARWQHAAKSAPSALGVISGITGQGDIARRERNFLSGIRAAGVRMAARAPARVQGHAVEGAFFANAILGLMCLEHGTLGRPLDESEPLETVRLDDKLERVLVTSWGSRFAEGFAELEAVS